MNKTVDVTHVNEGQSILFISSHKDSNKAYYVCIFMCLCFAEVVMCKYNKTNRGIRKKQLTIKIS